MRIKTTVKLATVIIISVVLFYSAFIIIINRTMESKYRDLRTASDIRIIFSRLRSLTTDYMLCQTERARQQWWTVRGELLHMVHTPGYQAFQSKYQTRDLGEGLKLMSEAFSKLTAAFAKTGLSASKGQADQEFQNRLITQIMVLSREIGANFNQLSEQINGDVVSLQRRSTWLDVIALSILILFILTNSIFLSRSVVEPVLQLHHGARTIGQGNLDYRVATTGTGEIRELAQAINEMTVNLKSLTDSLQQSQQDLRLLTSQLISAQERERKRLAMELHEGLGQYLTALKMYLRVIQRNLPTESAAIIEDFEGAQSLLVEMIEEVRHISRGLNPTLLENLGLTAAFKHLLDEFSNYQAIGIKVDIDDMQALFSPETETNLFRILQEALNNITKHAQATQVSVTIKRQDGRVNFFIKDNGVGVDLEQITQRTKDDKGMGLASMDERLRMIGAHLNIVSQTGMGTEISFSIPCDAQ